MGFRLTFSFLMRFPLINGKEISHKMRPPEVNKMEVEVKDIIPKNWKYKETNDLITVWYKNLNKSPTPLTIKKSIQINEGLGIFLGFWAGDGGKIEFSLVNNNTKLLNAVYENMKESIGDISLKLKLMIPPNFIDIKEEIIKNAKNIFSGIKEVRITNYKKERNQPIYQLINSKIMTISFIKHLHNYFSENIPKKDSFWDGYLKGIIAAEGCMGLRRRYNTLSKISIAQENLKIRQNIFESLKARSIHYSFNKSYIYICGKENFNIVFKRGLHILHPVKKNKFLLGYNNIKQEQYSDEEAELKILNELKHPIRVSEIAKKLNRGRQTIREHIKLKSNSLIERGLIKRCGKERGFRGSFYGELWTLTKKGLNYLDGCERLND